MIPLMCLQEKCVVEVALEALVIEPPLPMPGPVHDVIERDSECPRRMWVRADGVSWRREGEIIVAALPVVGIGPRLRAWL